MPDKQYTVDLAENERTELESFVSSGVHKAEDITRARILLKAGDGATDAEISRALDCSMSTPYRARKRYADRGIAAVHRRNPDRDYQRKLDGDDEAHLIALATSERARSDLRNVWILTAPIECMTGTRRLELIEHLSEAELDIAINEAQMVDEARLVRRLCFVKNLYAGDVLKEAARRVGVSPANSSRWAHAWNKAGVDGLRPSFGGGRPPKLSDEQFAELCEILEEGQPWTPRAIHALIEERYGVIYDPAHLSRKLRASGMHYAKPRPMNPRSPENADEILTERLAKALGERDIDEQEDDPVVLGFFR